MAVAATDEFQEIDYSKPAFVGEAIYQTGRTTVFGTAYSEGTAIVILEAGSAKGFRNGMLCDIYQGEKTKGNIILVEVMRERSVGLILDLASKQTIKFGDSVIIRTVKN